RASGSASDLSNDRGRPPMRSHRADVTVAARMLFPTVQFALFFPVVLAASWTLMARPALWKPFIIFASYVFYASANWKFCLLLGGVTLGNQLFAVLIPRTASERARSALLAAAVTLDLAVLGLFKYYAFFVTDVGDVLDAIRL